MIAFLEYKDARLQVIGARACRPHQEVLRHNNVKRASSGLLRLWVVSSAQPLPGDRCSLLVLQVSQTDPCAIHRHGC
jgi:hypothetical protein